MFAAHVTDFNYFVFTDADPRDDGFNGIVETDVTFEDNDDFEWPEGQLGPQHVLGVSQSNPKDYKVFKYDTDGIKVGFKILGSNSWAGPSYAAFLRARHNSATPIGTLRRLFHGFWRQKGAQIAQDGGFNDPPPSRKRRLTREYLDGEPPMNTNLRKFWHPLKEHEKTLHLLDAFPDGDELD